MVKRVITWVIIKIQDGLGSIIINLESSPCCATKPLFMALWGGPDYT